MTRVVLNGTLCASTNVVPVSNIVSNFSKILNVNLSAIAIEPNASALNPSISGHR